jgi:serine/threonine-protein kinase
MAPEQYEGARATAASDQYSFCMALYEGLYRRPPFVPKRGGRPIDALLALKKAGLPPTPPPGSSVPGWVYEALARGLAPDPGRRHPSMDALIAALDVERTEQQEREARLRALEGDQDHTVGARARFVVLSLLGLFSAIVSLLGWRDPRLASIGHLIAYILVLNVALWVAIAVWHRRLLASQMGRLATGSTAVVGLAILFNRLIALRLGTPVSQVLMVDMGLMSVILAFGGLLVQGFRKSGLALAATSAAGVLLTLARPELAVPAASWCSVIALAGLAFTAYRHAARR